jgi:hypothetical protein
MTARTRTTSQRASPLPVPKLGSRCFPVVSISAEAELSATEPSFWGVSAEAESSRRDTFGFLVRSRPAEAGQIAHLIPEGCLPPSSRRSGSRVQDTQRGNSTTTPMGFGSFRRLNPGDRCTGLPHPHHPLSGFLTLSAVSSRPGLVALFRATSALRICFGLQSFSLSASRDTSRRPLLSCRFGLRRLRSSELELGLCPCRLLPRIGRSFPGRHPNCLLVQPRQEVLASSRRRLTEVVGRRASGLDR